MTGSPAAAAETDEAPRRGEGASGRAASLGSQFMMTEREKGHPGSRGLDKPHLASPTPGARVAPAVVLEKGSRVSPDPTATPAFRPQGPANRSAPPRAPTARMGYVRRAASSRPRQGCGADLFARSVPRKKTFKTPAPRGPPRSYPAQEEERLDDRGGQDERDPTRRRPASGKCSSRPTIARSDGEGRRGSF